MFKFLNNLYNSQRFKPNLFSIFINPFFFNRRSLYKIIKEYSNFVKGKTLDFGCGSKPYEQIFINVTEYIGVDVSLESHSHLNEKIDILYDGFNLPFHDNSFDSVFTSEVLEHVPNIHNALYEINRVMKLNGSLLITIPFVVPEHEKPNDFRRLTSFGIEKVLEETNFQVISIKKHGTFHQVISQLKIWYIHDLLYTKNKFFNIILNIFFISPITLLSLLISPFIKSNSNLFFGTIVLAKKIKNNV